MQKAIEVNKGEELFTDVVRRIRSNIDIDKTSESISKIRETKKGNIFIEIKSGSDAAENVQREVEKSIGTDTYVRRIRHRQLVELHNLDCITSEIYIEEAVQARI